MYSGYTKYSPDSVEAFTHIPAPTKENPALRLEHTDNQTFFRGVQSRVRQPRGGLAPSPAGPATASARRAESRDAWWGASTAKVLELIPLNDAFSPAATRDDYKRQYSDRVTTVLIPNAGHALLPQQPAAVQKAILEWAASL